MIARKLYTVVLAASLLMVSCGNKDKKESSPSAPISDYSAPYTPYQQEEAKTNDTVSLSKPVGIAPPKEMTHDTYDDGYLDGEAMAEEDRLAGKPGMQVGMDNDEDDDDYEDGFDDGYDE